MTPSEKAKTRTNTGFLTSLAGCKTPLPPARRPSLNADKKLRGYPPSLPSSLYNVSSHQQQESLNLPFQRINHANHGTNIHNCKDKSLPTRQDNQATE